MNTIFKKIFFAVSLIIIFDSSYAQLQNRKINSDNFKEQELSAIIFDKINKVRDSLGLPIYKKDEALKLAAKNQAEFIAKIDKLTHQQKSKKFANPLKRVKFYNQKFETVAENLAYVSAGVTKITNGKKEILYKTYEEVACELVDNWIYSKQHFENIADEGMTRSGLALVYDQKTNRVYAVQTFGEKSDK